MERLWYQTEPNSEERIAEYYRLYTKVPGDFEGKQMVRVADRNAPRVEEIICGVFSEDPMEQKRRFELLSRDSIYLGFSQRYKAATAEEKHDIFSLLHLRSVQFAIVRDPEAILNDPESFRPKD
ncbi:hypothetical protein A3F00_04475 [Candidatus Daviesbacteria bacterium RIFCSPHIGHO2_12_FULL_37_11]|uniref:Uncharacterized protein n=1 Tax=Candidatus Daviesbacteria bacterium RIFCSPHIGHO2_12_FULL_37_11 TaxID=1797777 RepID=A0A1F5K9W1_9BACT|nr:MAG: hypothetical protein A2111_02260 [Candidatus Daviesbacteria bacterium GWA1_38_6]OGE16156.1 MAG: hypothetical protein A2769_03645 [Candidatus Daviesbacteria bacterium RIFCSPHIGHO2_01_FULL_37_27]OGE37679.1 MAG: hypothetical protein A3F00_04475 [Candidatus Daviesbacteria bacterium RIFCSPHIGHO2_12_FULL_37_11]OGE45434.1 MAG: hypothetical protein A3B39_04875 [Candidatus Daviesbacteria bacterium RIFCSPLOWO2_01_FULL_37_10]